jgi:hypothetical protein
VFETPPSAREWAVHVDVVSSFFPPPPPNTLPPCCLYRWDLYSKSSHDLLLLLFTRLLALSCMNLAFVSVHSFDVLAVRKLAANGGLKLLKNG